MSQMVGADIGELRELAATFNAKAAQLKSIESQLNWRIHSAPWEGHDVSRFVQDWNTRHRKVILGASASIAGAAQDLLAHAQQQELASTAGYTGGIASVAALRNQEAVRVASLGVASWLGAVGIAGSAFLRKIRTAHDIGGLVNKAQLYSMRAQRSLGIIQKWGGTLTPRSLWYAVKNADSVVTKGDLYKSVKFAGGRVLAPIGAILSAVDLADSVSKGDAGGIIVHGMSLVANVATTAVFFGAFTPVGPAILAVAGVWTVASLAYEHRETLGRAMSWVGERVSDAGRVVADRVTDVVHSAGQTVQRAADTARSVVDRITNPLRSVFG